MTRVFDIFAETFDQALHRIEYRAPALVGQALQRTEGEPRGELDVVDAGCGTGLLAGYLRPYARRLVGVDLSPRMLEKAAGQRRYDELLAVELTSFLRSSPRAFDVVASSDTLVYFGDLRAALAAAAVALRPGGRLVFTLEHALREEDAPAGYRIHPHGRYSHTEAYVRATLADAGFGPVDIEKAHLRREGECYVDGLVVAARLAKAPEVALESPTRGELASAAELQRQGLLEQAVAAYFKLLKDEPNNAEALRRLGAIAYEQRRSILALNLLLRVVELNPTNADAHVTLGDIYRQLNSIGNAARAYAKALELRPDHPEASRELAQLRPELEQLEQSAESRRRAIEQDPGNVEHYYALVAAYEKMGRSAEDRIAVLGKALAIRPDARGFRQLGLLLEGMSRLKEAAATYEAWLRAEPGNPTAGHMLAACTGKDIPPRASDEFVTQLFDRNADIFDERLGRLEYRAPALIGSVLRHIHGEPRGELDALDAGCGTGLLAEHLRPYARRLVGVDLSRRMLEKAATRGGYDELVAAELSAYLRSSPGAFDVVASSDTLVYFGALDEVLAAAGVALRPGGTLFFTLEHAKQEGEAPAGYRINSNGRYSHTESYVRRALAEAGFEHVELQQSHLRWESGRYVDGLLAAARRPRQQ